MVYALMHTFCTVVQLHLGDSVKYFRYVLFRFPSYLFYNRLCVDNFYLYDLISA